MAKVVPLRRTGPVPYSWREVARTFDGNRYWGNFGKCSEEGERVDFAMDRGAPVEGFTTVELLSHLYFAAWADASGEPSGAGCPRQETIVCELIRRHGRGWLDAEIRRVRAEPRPPSCPNCGSHDQVAPLVRRRPKPEAFRPPRLHEFYPLGDCPCPKCGGRGWVWTCAACDERF
jgi:hypothetical protein